MYRRYLYPNSNIYYSPLQRHFNNPQRHYYHPCPDPLFCFYPYPYYDPRLVRHRRRKRRKMSDKSCKSSSKASGKKSKNEGNGSSMDKSRTASTKESKCGSKKSTSRSKTCASRSTTSEFLDAIINPELMFATPPRGQRPRCYVRKPLISTLFEQTKVSCFCDWPECPPPPPTPCFVPKCGYTDKSVKNRRRGHRNYADRDPCNPGNFVYCDCKYCVRGCSRKYCLKSKASSCSRRDGASSSGMADYDGKVKRKKSCSKRGKKELVCEIHPTSSSASISSKKKSRGKNSQLRVQLGDTMLVFDNVEVHES